MPEKIKMLSILKKMIVIAIKQSPDDQFPCHLIFQESPELPVYKITIDVENQDYFYDCRGVKWLRAKEDKPVS